MSKLEDKKADIIDFLEEQGYTVSNSYSLEPQGNLFAEVHIAVQQINNNLAVYQQFNTLEIELMAIVDPETEKTIVKTIELLSDEHSVYSNTVDANTIIIKMRGNYFD